MAEIVTLKVEDGALTQVPVYETHRRGKNWLAVIAPDPKSPGGLKRTFVERAKGSYYYMADTLKPGDPVEFGADYYTGSGHKQVCRWYGVVVDVRPDAVVLEHMPGPKSAFARSREIIESTEDEAPDTDVLLLTAYPDETLIAELERRGYKVVKGAAV